MDDQERRLEWMAGRTRLNVWLFEVRGIRSRKYLQPHECHPKGASVERYFADGGPDRETELAEWIAYRCAPVTASLVSGKTWTKLNDNGRQFAIRFLSNGTLFESDGDDAWEGRWSVLDGVLVTAIGPYCTGYIYGAGKFAGVEEDVAAQIEFNGYSVLTPDTEG